MIHQWWCGGHDPCACTDGWKALTDVQRAHPHEPEGENVIDLDALDEKLAAATAGPWYWYCDAMHSESAVIFDDGSAGGEYTPTVKSRHDMELIEALRNAAPELIRELRAARAFIESVRPSGDAATRANEPAPTEDR
jgi:hypothetical protein